MKFKNYNAKYLKFFTTAVAFLFLVGNAVAQISLPNEIDGMNYGTTEKSIVAYIHKGDNKYTVNKLEMIDGQSDYQYDYKIYKGTDYNGGVISFSGKSLGYFPANQMIMVMCWDDFNPNTKDRGGCEELPEGDIQLRIPYFPNGKYVEIYNLQGNKILIIDLSSVAVCNENGSCDKPIEDNSNCPFDCKLKSGEDDKITGQQNQNISSDEDGLQEKGRVNQGVDQAESGNRWKMLLIVVVLAAIIGAVIFWLIKRKNSLQDYSEDK